MEIDPIRIEGLQPFVRGLRKMDGELPKQLRLGFNDAANLVVEDARRPMPSVTGRARKSVRARSTRTAVRVVAGGPRVPYYPWLDYGGKVGRNRSVSRRFISDGRYLYPAFRANRDKVRERLTTALADAGRAAGIEVT